MRQFFHQRRERQDERACDEIADTMNDIKRRACEDPSDHLFKIQAEHPSLRGRVKNTEREPVQTADERINDTRELFRHIFRQEHRDRPKDRPNVKIGDPPEIKSRVQTVEHHVYVDRKQRFFAKNDRIDHGEHSEQVNVWQDLHDELGAEHQCAEHGEYDDLFDLLRGFSRVFISCRQADRSHLLQELFDPHLSGKVRR